MKRVALTGGIATGKSHVRATLERLGVPTIDADTLAREVVAPGTPGLAAVVERFGAQVLDENGALNRSRLGTIVFSDPAARRALESIIHPSVQTATDRWFESLGPSGHPFAVADIPLLYEVGRNRDFDLVIVTACEPVAQLRRLMARDGLNEIEARQRIDAQLSLAEKVRRADYVVKTDGTFEDTERQVRETVRRIVDSG